jgi:hypothetical protein
MNAYYLIGSLIAIVILAGVGLAVWNIRQDDLHHGKFTEFEGE